MKTNQIFLAALLTLGLSGAAFAQTGTTAGSTGGTGSTSGSMGTTSGTTSGSTTR